ncbi:NUDIX hydrolase [Candidatus Dojkabacteria bacterium]|nr:NUDIX hydrolase [Candidatus Dojkabacteria bacterium]
MSILSGGNLEREDVETFRKGAKVILLRNPKDPEVLMLKHHKGYLLLPGGAIETCDFDSLEAAFGDKPTLEELWYAAFDRELREEGVTNPIAYDDNLKFVVGSAWQKDGKPCMDYAGIIWLDEELSFSVTPSSEIIGFEWMPVKTVLSEYAGEKVNDGLLIPHNIWSLVDMAYTAIQMGYEDFYALMKDQ